MNRILYFALAVCHFSGLASAAPWQHNCDQDNLLINGSFEDGCTVTNTSVLTFPTACLTPWIPGTTGSVGLNGPAAWTSSEGTYNIELAGNAPGSVSQSFPTDVGQTYMVHFDYAANPLGPVSLVRNMGTHVSTSPATSASFVAASTGSTAAVGWQPGSYSFRATDTTTTIAFYSTDPNDVNGAFGVLLDAVCITPAKGIAFSVDYWSPTVSMNDSKYGQPITGGDILMPEARRPQLGPLDTPDMEVWHGDPGLGLLPGCMGEPAGERCWVDVDALSYGHDALLTDPTLIGAGQVLFSVDPQAQGWPTILAPSLASESPVGDASADVFGNLSPLSLPLAFAAVGQHVGLLDGDGETSASGSTYCGLGLTEPNSPIPGVVDGDDLDALDTGVESDFPAGGVYFSLEGLAAAGAADYHSVRSADVLFKSSPSAPFVVFATSFELGLDLAGAQDDLDALILAENGNGVFDPSIVPYDWVGGGTDMLLFSVRRGSNLIGGLDSRFGQPIVEGDILTTPHLGVAGLPAIFLPAEALGLRTTRAGFATSDDIDALDLSGCPLKDCDGNGIEDGIQIALQPGLDLNGNGMLDTCELTATSFCFCATGAPCSNPDPTAGCRNSTGLGGLLEASGSSIWANDDLILTASQLPANSAGILFKGPIPIAPVPFADGLRCVGGPLGRFPVQFSGFSGTVSYGPGIIAQSASGLSSCTISSGSTWIFQFWYRDALHGSCTLMSNVTSAVSVTF